MDKYDLTQEQWDEMVIAKLDATQKELNEGTAKLFPFKKTHARVLKRIEEIAQKERAKTVLTLQTSYIDESETASL